MALRRFFPLAGEICLVARWAIVSRCREGWRREKESTARSGLPLFFVASVLIFRGFAALRCFRSLCGGAFRQLVLFVVVLRVLLTRAIEKERAQLLLNKSP